MKKIYALFLAVFMIMTILPVVPMTMVSAAESSFVNATFESDDSTTWTTVNNITVSKTSGGAGGSGYALKNEITNGSLNFSFQDYGAAMFAFKPEAGARCILSADVKLVTCASTLPTKVSFVLRDSSNKETVVAATLDKALSKTDWSHCTAEYIAGANIVSIGLRIGSGKITEIGSSSGSFLKSYNCTFLTDNITALPEASCADYLAMDFEDGWYPNFGKVSNNSSVTWSDTDTFHGSNGAIHFTTTTTYGSIQFPLRAAVGNSYDISVWIKPDKTPTIQKVTFNIYSPTADGNKSTTWNTVNAKYDGSLEAGKWTLCTATFTPDGKGTYMPDGVSVRTEVLEESTIELRLGNGLPADTMEGEIAFMMDDFFVFPNVDNKLDPKERISYGGLTTQADFEAGWKSTGNSTVTWQEEGANGTAGSAVVEVLGDWGTMRTNDTVEIEFGRVYSLTFWAKAVSEDAIGLEMYAYLMYNGHKTLEDTPKWFVTKAAKEPYTLTTEWQQYTVNFTPTSTTIEKIHPYIYFRCGAGTERVTFAVDDVSLVQVGDSNFNVGTSAMKTASGNEVILQMNFTESSSKHFLYKVIRETASGNEVLRTIKTTDNYIYLDEEEYTDLSNVRFEVVGVDAFNLCSRKSICRVAQAVPEDNIQLTADQYIWTKDMPNVSATVTYDNQTQGRTLRLFGA